MKSICLASWYWQFYQKFVSVNPSILKVVRLHLFYCSCYSIFPPFLFVFSCLLKMVYFFRISIARVSRKNREWSLWSFCKLEPKSFRTMFVVRCPLSWWESTNVVSMVVFQNVKFYITLPLWHRSLCMVLVLVSNRNPDEHRRTIFVAIVDSLWLQSPNIYDTMEKVTNNDGDGYMNSAYYNSIFVIFKKMREYYYPKHPLFFWDSKILVIFPKFTQNAIVLCYYQQVVII